MATPSGAPLRAVTLLLLAGCAGVPAATGGAAPGPVTLRFGWPDGLQVQVAIRHQVQRTGQPPAGAAIRHRLVAERRGDELWILNRDVAGQGNLPHLELNLKVARTVVQVVGPDGGFRRAEGIEEAAALLEPVEGRARERSRQALARIVAEDWEMTVGTWRGRTLREGRLERRRVDASVPNAPGVPTLLEVEYGLEGLVPCREEETERRCAALVYRGRPADSDRAATLARLRESMGGADGPELEDLQAALEVRLVSEVATLLPHRMVVHEELRLRLRLPDGRVREVEERSRDEYDFRPEAAI